MSVKGMIVGAAFSITAAVLCTFIFAIVVSTSFLMAAPSIMYIGVFLQVVVPFPDGFQYCWSTIQKN